MRIIKTIIIGAVAAGMSAAAKLRRLDKDAEITVYEKGMDISYGACGMPYVLGGIINNVEALTIRHKEDFDKMNINVFLHHEVITVIPELKQITIIDHTTNQLIYDNYDYLVIATGASAKRTYVSGSNNPNIHVLKTLSDIRKINDHVKDANSVAIIGAGYIGIEVADNLNRLGIKVHIIQDLDQILNSFDYDVAKKVMDDMERTGIEIHMHEELESYESSDGHIVINTNHNSYQVDLVIETIGIKPNTVFLRETGMDMMDNGAIIVNEKMETSIHYIYAAGDCAAYRNILKEEFDYLPLGTHANKTGRIVAENIAGLDTEFSGIVGTSILKVNELAVAKTGIGYDEARRNNLDYDHVDVVAKNHAEYFPGGEDIFIRVIYERNSGILKGAQIIGKMGVNDRINIMALAITKNMTAKEFSQLDFAYTPPLSPVWDPLQVATNQIKI